MPTEFSILDALTAQMIAMWNTPGISAEAWSELFDALMAALEMEAEP